MRDYPAHWTNAIKTSSQRLCDDSLFNNPTSAEKHEAASREWQKTDTIFAVSLKTKQPQWRNAVTFSCCESTNQMAHVIFQADPEIYRISCAAVRFPSIGKREKPISFLNNRHEHVFEHRLGNMWNDIRMALMNCITKRMIQVKNLICMDNPHNPKSRKSYVRSFLHSSIDMLIRSMIYGVAANQKPIC